MIFVSLKFFDYFLEKCLPKRKKKYLRKGEIDPRKVVGAPIHVSATLVFSNKAKVNRKVGPIATGEPKFADGTVKEVRHRLTRTTHKETIVICFVTLIFVANPMRRKYILLK